MIAKRVTELKPAAVALPRAIALLWSHPKLLVLCIAPITIGIAMYGIVIAIILWLVNAQTAQWFSFSDGLWAGGLQLLVAVVLVITIGWIALLFIIMLINVVAGPFHEQLSQRVERIATGASAHEALFSWRVLFRDSWRAIKEELVKLVLFSGLQLLLLLLHFIPVVGSVVYLVLNFLLSGLLLSYEYLDLPLARHEIHFRDKIRYIITQPLRHAIFGWLCMLILVIPIVNIVFIPICVIAGTLVYCHYEAAD